MNEADKQKIKDDVQNCFIERNENTIAEKISELILAGFTEDEARHTVIQVVENLSNVLLPLKVVPQEDVFSDISDANVVYCDPRIKCIYRQ